MSDDYVMQKKNLRTLKSLEKFVNHISKYVAIESVVKYLFEIVRSV